MKIAKFKTKTPRVKNPRKICDSTSESEGESDYKNINRKEMKQAEKDNNNMDINNDPDSEGEYHLVQKKKRRIQDENDPTFSHPSTSKKTAQKQKTTTNIESKNQYTILEIQNAPENNTDEQEVNTGRKTNKKSNKPPPIHIHGRFVDLKKVDEQMKKHAPGGFHYKFLGKDQMLIITNVYEDYKKAVEFLRKKHTDFHTYTPKEEKTHAFVLKGLCRELPPEELKEELATQIECIKNVYKMKGTPEYAPAYLIVTDATIKLSELQHKVKYAMHTAIRWERHFNNKIIIQCHNCQGWGHATSNCFAGPACLKCGENHVTKDCKKPVTTPPKCANCGAAHLSNSTECVVYKKALEKTRITKENNEPAPAYRPAPLPTQNYWERRKTNQQNQNSSNGAHIQQETQHPERRQPINRTNYNNQVSTDSISQVNELTSEYIELNRLINVDRMLSLVRQLNAKLRTCTDSLSQFAAFNTFVNELISSNLA